jgi:enterochelin esterase-like enzyme
VRSLLVKIRNVIIISRKLTNPSIHSLVSRAHGWKKSVGASIVALGLLFGLAACNSSKSDQVINPLPAVSVTLAPLPSPTETATGQPVLTQPAIRSATQTASPAPIPSQTATPTSLTCQAQVGRIETGIVRSDLLRLPMEFRIYLPPCYDQHLHQRYPVLYLIHGQNYNDDQWDRLGADETANRLIAAGEIPAFLIVMPRDRNWSQPTEDNFGRVVVESLIPLIDANYRTLAERDGRAVGGLSRGAGWAIHLGLSKWELFSAIGAHSLPLFWTDLPHLREWIAAIPPEALPRIYMDLGDKERPQIAKSAYWFEQLLTDLGIPHEWHLYPGYHEEDYWKVHLEEYLRWYAEGWQTP